MTDREFESEVEGWVRNALVAAETWPALLRALPGVYPMEALDAIHRLASYGQTSPSVRSQLASIAAQAKASCPLGSPFQPWRKNGRPLAVPHPLDFEWRFTPSTADDLLDTYGRGREAVALIGVPTLFIRAAERGMRGQFALFDRNPSTVSCILNTFPSSQVYVHDACYDAPPMGAFGAAVLDPPWYDPHVRGFLWTAAHTVRTGGVVRLSLPPQGTRPGIADERHSLFEWARTHLGLDLVSVEPGRLRYVSPPFEWNALRAAAIGEVPADWRCGDLATFIVGRDLLEATASRPPQPPQSTPWVEVGVLGVRVRFRPQEPQTLSPPTLDPIVPGGVLPSVSARDPRRNAASVWTSGNRAFASTDPLRLREELVSLIQEDNLPQPSASQPKALRHLLMTIFQEHREYAADAKLHQ